MTGMNFNYLPKGLQDILHNNKLAGDFWGGLAAMLVALPSAIAFGVTIYAAIGPAYASLGAIAGILGATALGLVAPALGGTNRLITAPCAPAAAVMAAVAVRRVAVPLAAARRTVAAVAVAAALGFHPQAAGVAVPPAAVD